MTDDAVVPGGQAGSGDVTGGGDTTESGEEGQARQPAPGWRLAATRGGAAGHQAAPAASASMTKIAPPSNAGTVPAPSVAPDVATAGQAGVPAARPDQDSSAAPSAADDWPPPDET